jgi:hypothetical protein
VRRWVTEFRSSERHVCKLMEVPRSSGRCRSRRDESQIQEQLRELAREHLRFGYRRQYLCLRKEMTVDYKKVQRVYREPGLSVMRTRRKHLRRTSQPRFNNFAAPGTAPDRSSALPTIRLALFERLVAFRTA